MPAPKKVDLIVPIHWRFWVFVCLLALVGVGLCRLVPTLLRSPERAVKDVKYAVARGDTRFVSVLCGTICVPGIGDGQFNSLVLLHKYKNPIGIGDCIFNSIQAKQQELAMNYAFAYNSRLLSYILSHPDAKTLRYLTQVRQQLSKLENADPKRDALLAFQKNKSFLLMTGNRDFGYPIEDNRSSWIGTQELLINSEIFQGKERKRFDKVIRSYVVPHNQELYRLLQQKWKQQGIKEGMRPR